jgi:hypothetical protein
VISASLSALSGMRASMAKMDASAARLAGQPADPTGELIDQLAIKTDFTANIAVFKAAGDMEEGAIRLWA